MNSTTPRPVITADRMSSNVTPHTATGFPDGWRVTWLGDRTVDYNQAITAMLIAVEVATKDLDADQAARWLIEDLAGELDLGMFEAISMVTGIEATRDLPGFVGDAYDQGAEDEYEARLDAERTAERAAGFVARIERVRKRIEPSGPQAQRMFMLLIDAMLTDIELSDEDDEPLFVAEQLAAFVGQLIRGEWRPVAEALAALKSQKAG
jgi:hypothetical protein